MKKIISLLLSFVMIFTLTIPTFAASDKSLAETGNKKKQRFSYLLAVTLKLRY